MVGSRLGGRHAGAVALYARLDTTTCCPLPSGLIRAITDRCAVGSQRVNAIQRPSGDHAGLPSDDPWLVAIRRGLLPSARDTTRAVACETAVQTRYASDPFRETAGA